jgi:hypothetical protein
MAQGSSDRTAATPSYSSPTTAANSTPGYKPPTAGAAAGMNGYATGPYNTFGQAGAASSLATSGAPARPATPPSAPGTPGTAAGYAASNPYAPANPYAPPAGQSVGLPSSQAYGSGVAANGVYGGRPSVAPALAAAPGMAAPGMAAPGMAVPGMAAPGMAAAGSLGMPPNPALGGAAAVPPNAFASSNPTAMPNAGQMNFPINGGTYNPVGSAGTAMPAGAAMSAPNGFAQSAPTNPGMNGSFAMPTSQPNFAPPGGMQSVPAQTAGFAMNSPSNAATASFRPGSTSRSTGYNFSQQGSAPGQGNTAVAGAQPNFTSTPYTASGANNPGYSLPPSSTLNR